MARPRIEHVPALLAYMDQHGPKETAALLGVSQGALYHWTSGRRSITGETAVEIERKTNGELKREDLRPDLFRPADAA